MNKKLILVAIIIVGAIVGLWSWTLAVPSNSISIGGSASVQPLLKKFTNNYQTDGNKNFVYSATGSGAGITNVKSEVYEIGFISKKVNSKDWDANNAPINENDNILSSANVESWTENNSDWYFNQLINDPTIIDDSYRAIELARDSFVFVYNDQGTGFQEFLDASGLSFTFELNENNQISSQGATILHNIYEKDSQDNLWSWRELAFYLAGDNLEYQKLAQNVSKQKITPYSSTSGSGTRGSFTDLTEFTDVDGKTRGLSPGQGVKEYNSNGAIYGQLISSPGSIGFVSMLYGENLTKDVKAVQIKKQDSVWNLNTSDVVEGYPLTRPFIAILKVNKNDPLFKDAAEFIYWMTTSEEAFDFYGELGLERSVSTMNGQ